MRRSSFSWPVPYGAGVLIRIVVGVGALRSSVGRRATAGHALRRHRIVPGPEAHHHARMSRVWPTSDFNDRATSMLVRGRIVAVLCVDPDFRGDCTVLEPGESGIWTSASWHYLVFAADGRRGASRRLVRAARSRAAGHCRSRDSRLMQDRAGWILSGCQITCQPGQQAKWSRGSEWAHATGTRGECALQSRCECK